MGLISASLYINGSNQLARYYADILVLYVNNISGSVSQSLTTITSSGGINRVIETTSIAVITWLNEQRRFSASITKAVNWLVS